MVGEMKRCWNCGWTAALASYPWVLATNGQEYCSHGCLERDEAVPEASYLGLPSFKGTAGSPVEGRKDDAGKPRYDLIPPEMLDALAALYARGALKYEARNWEKGFAWGRSFAACMRHAWAFWRGEDKDAETGASHLIAAIWNLAAIYTFQVRSVGQDDRPVLDRAREPKEPPR